MPALGYVEFLEPDGLIKPGSKIDLFCYHYARGLSGTQAAVEAKLGVNRNSCGNLAIKYLRKPVVQARIKEFIDDANEAVKARAGIEAADVVNELAKIGFFNLESIVEVRGKSAYLDFSKAEPEHFAAISSLETKTVASKDEDSDEIILETKVKFHDKRAALIAIGQTLGMFGPAGAARNITPDEPVDPHADEVNPQIAKREDAKKIAFFLRQQAEENPAPVFVAPPKPTAPAQPVVIEGTATEVADDDDDDDLNWDDD